MDYTNLISSLITTGGTLFGIWLQKKITEQNKPDLSDSDYDDLLRPVIGLIADELNAERINYMSFHNGEKTFDGYSLKNLSMMVEINKDLVDNIIDEMQKIPAISFKRLITKLKQYNTENYIISYESDIQDNLSGFYLGYHIRTAIFCKINNKNKRNPWTGILTIGFEQPNKQFTTEQLNWLNVQVDKINLIVSNM